MANQTVTTPQSLASVIAGGLDNGQNITINAGAVITAIVSPTVLLGQISTNDGKYLFDGANAVNPIIACGEETEEINVNGAGVFETTLGWYIFTGTSSGLSGYTLNVAEYFSADPNNNISADIFAGMSVETGRRIIYDGDSGIAPVVGDWLFKVTDNHVMGRISEVGVNYVVVEALTGTLADNDAIELHTLQDNNGIDYQKSWNALVNNALGDILELDVWTKWANVRANGVDHLSDVGSSIDGFAFNNEHGTNNVIFGTGTNGRIPPVGCRFRMPMVHFCSSTIAQFTLGNTTTPAGTGTPYNIELGLGGDAILRGVSIGSAVFVDAGASSFTAEHVYCHIALGSAIAGSRAIFTECMIVASLFSASSSSRRYPFDLSDLAEGAELTDCAVYNLLPSSGETGLLASVTSKNIAITRCVSVGLSTSEENSFQRTDGITIYDYIAYNVATEFSTCFNVDARLLKLSGKIAGSARSVKSTVNILTSTDSVFIAGIEILDGEGYQGNLFSVGDSSNIKFRGFHFIDDKFNAPTVTAICRTTGLTSNISFARIWVEGNTGAIYTGTAVSSGVTVDNVSGNYAREVEPRGVDIYLNGVHGGSGVMGSGTGVETDYTGSFGGNSSCIMRSDTTGVIASHFKPASTANPFLNITGNPKFTKDGDMDMVDGDSFTIETPIYYAITAFTGQYTSSRNSGTVSDGTDEIGSLLTTELQYDTGSGYNGVWLNCKSIPDMTSIPDLRTGARFRIRYTATGDRTNNNGTFIHFTTSIAAQKANLAPIDQLEVPLQILQCNIGSAVYLQRLDTGEVLIDEIALTTTVSVTFIYGGFDVPVRIRHRDSSVGGTQKKRYTQLDTITPLGLKHTINFNNDTLAT